MTIEDGLPECPNGDGCSSVHCVVHGPEHKGDRVISRHDALARSLIDAGAAKPHEFPVRVDAHALATQGTGAVHAVLEARRAATLPAPAPSPSARDRDTDPPPAPAHDDDDDDDDAGDLDAGDDDDDDDFAP
jgi:hypothetical protein